MYRTRKWKAVISTLVFAVLFAFGAVFMTACQSECTHENMENHPAVSATCTKEGNSEYWSCPDCGRMFADAAATRQIGQDETVIAIDPEAHKFGAMQPETEASCTTPGTKAHKDCEYCKKHFSADGTEIIDLTTDALGHSYSGITITTKPTKLTYIAGEDFDASGMTVQAVCENCRTVSTISDYTLSGNTALEKGEKQIKVVWNDGTKDFSATVSVDVYEKHDLLTEESCADFVYAPSGDLTATVREQLNGTVADVVCNQETYSDGMALSGTSVTLKEQTAQGILDGKTYGDFAVSLYTDTYDLYTMNISVVTKVIASAKDLAEITAENTEELIDGYYIVSEDFDAAEAGRVYFVNNTAKLNDSIGFKGIFDGRGHTISNISTASYNGELGGLFGQLLPGSVVRNITFFGLTAEKRAEGNAAVALIGESAKMLGTIENVIVTAREGETIGRIVSNLAGGTIKNCMFIGATVLSNNGNGTAVSNVISVTTGDVDHSKQNGGFPNSGGYKYADNPNYDTVNEMLAALQKGEVSLNDWGSIVYRDGAVYFSDSENAIVLPVIEMSDPVENGEIQRGTSVTFETEGCYVALSLKQAVNNVSLENDVLTVGIDVAENTTVTVVAASTLNETVTREFTYKVIRAYQDESLGTADLSLERENESVKASIEGAIERITLAGEILEGTTGVTYADGNLTFTKEAMNMLLKGKPYAEGLALNIFTTADKNYALTLNICTMFIDGAEDLKSVTEKNTAATIDAYYIVTASFDASAAGVVRIVNNNTASNNEIGFQGIFDGRGHIISNITTESPAYNGLGGLFGLLLKGSVVKNIAFTDVTAETRGFVISGESKPFHGTMENVVITAAEGETLGKVVSNMGTGTMKNCLFVGFEQLSVDGGTSSAQTVNVMSVTNACGTNGGFANSGGSLFKENANYPTVEAMFAALAENNLLQDWGSITYENGSIRFNGVTVLENAVSE